MNLSFIPDWLLPSILLSPALLWMFLGVGLPWALALLPRTDWPNRITVLAVALALGPALTTTAMFLIGTFGYFSVLNVLIASLLVAVIGAGLAWRNRLARERTESTPRVAVTGIDLALIGVIALSVVIRFWNTAYWPYTTYDEFWVYGYNAKIFMLRDNIPASMDYYPQFVPLTYTYSQLMWGDLNPHAARSVVPVFALGSILMAYALGARVFNRRVGLLTAAIWALYPQHSAWSQFGDLEVPVTLYHTATVAFFALGWRSRESANSRRYIVLSGLMLGAALWTKPTAGALIESLLLIAGVTAVHWFRQNRHIRAADLKTTLKTLWSVPLIRFPALALLVGAPLGGMWYIRNILYGHPPIIMPAGYWQDQAQRSGQELGWLLLIAVVSAALVILNRQRVKAAFGGLALILVGSLPSAFGYRLPTYGELSQLMLGSLPASLAPTRLTIFEYAIIAAGVALLGWSALPVWRRVAPEMRVITAIIAAFIAPYFVTWFWSYSYHPRLSFAIVPSLIVLFAALLDALRSARQPKVAPAPQMAPARRRLRIAALSVIVVALAVPGLIAGLTAIEPAVTRSLPNDHDKIARGNPALMAMVDYLTWRRDPNHRPAAMPRPLVVEAPGELRLPYFFPNDDIRATDYPVSLEQLKGVDYFVDNSVATKDYNLRGTLYYNQVLASLNREPVMTHEFGADDGNFRFDLYALHVDQRFRPVETLLRLDAQIGDFAVLRGADIGTLAQTPGQAVILTLSWQALGPAKLDYSVFIHLWDTQQQKAVGQWGGEPVAGFWPGWQHYAGIHVPVKYHTRLWEKGESIKDEWRIIMPVVPPGVYEMHVGLYDPISGARLPVMRNGQVLGDWVNLRNFAILAP